MTSHGPEPTPFHDIVLHEVNLRLAVEMAKARVGILFNRLETMSMEAARRELLNIAGILDVPPVLDGAEQVFGSGRSSHGYANQRDEHASKYVRPRNGHTEVDVDWIGGE